MIDFLANTAIVLCTIYCVVMSYIQIKDWIRKNRRG